MTLQRDSAGKLVIPAGSELAKNGVAHRYLVELGLYKRLVAVLEKDGIKVQPRNGEVAPRVAPEVRELVTIMLTAGVAAEEKRQVTPVATAPAAVAPAAVAPAPHEKGKEKPKG